MPSEIARRILCLYTAALCISAFPYEKSLCFPFGTDAAVGGRFRRPAVLAENQPANLPHQNRKRPGHCRRRQPFGQRRHHLQPPRAGRRGLHARRTQPPAKRQLQTAAESFGLADSAKTEKSRVRHRNRTNHRRHALCPNAPHHQPDRRFETRHRRLERRKTAERNRSRSRVYPRGRPVCPRQLRT